MATRFTSLGVAGTATIATLVATTVTLTTVGITTLNVTTSNVQTLSGATAAFTDPGDLVEAATLSGGTIRALQPSGIVRARTLSGAQIYTNTGIILNDTDGSGCSALHIKNGVLSAQTHDCP